MTVLAGVSFGSALGGVLFDPNSPFISFYFFSVQDVPVLVLLGAFYVVLRALLRNGPKTFALGSIELPVSIVFWITIMVACVIIWGGAHFVYRNFALSMDELMAEFDARILAAGQLLASVPPDWRPDVPALQPIFRLEVPENAYWVSGYLPMNAAMRAVFVLLGEPSWEGVVLAAIAIIALWGVARRLWPDRPDAAVVGVVLLACSSQFLITAMSAYAMTAHLALNMVWLWLFLRDTRTSHVMAVAAGFLACGLHQVVFHPLFIAPFIVSLVIGRRWKLAAFYVGCYAVIGLFWILYWSLLLRTTDAPLAQSAEVGITHFAEQIGNIIKLGPDTVVLMALNLFRFLAWQSPLTIPLAVVGLIACRDRNIGTLAAGTEVKLAAGMALTLLVMVTLAPFQGHGWGYRYLHGFLGALSLLAAQGWTRLTDRDAQRSNVPALAVSLSVLLSLFVLLPWRAYQVNAFIKPYAAAMASIEHSDADVVIVDTTDVWYGEDLVRNDPFLRKTPKVLSLRRLDEALLGGLCRRYDVAIFDRADAQRLGLRIVPTPADVVDLDSKLRALARSLNCGRPVLASRTAR